MKTKAVRSRLVLFLFPIFSIAFVAMSYELIEWWYAAAAGMLPERRSWEAREIFGTLRKICLPTRLAHYLRSLCFSLVNAQRTIASDPLEISRKTSRYESSSSCDLLTFDPSP